MINFLMMVTEYIDKFLISYFILLYHILVWSSNNGIDWELICPDAPWKGRMFHSLASFQGQIVLM